MANNDSTPAASNKSVNPPEWGAPEWEKISEDDFANNLITKVEGEEAILTPEEMDTIEKFWEQDRITRRCTLLLLTKPFSWLKEKIESDTEFARSMIEIHLCSDASKYNHIANLLHDAERRVMRAITYRDDMKELVDKAKAEQEVVE